MGMDIYLRKPILFPKHIWQNTDDGDDVRYFGNDSRNLLKKFIYEKYKTHTLESMSHACRLSVDDFVLFIDSQKYGIKSSEYPYNEKFEYIKSEEMGYCDGHGISEGYSAILHGRKISSRLILQHLAKDMFTDYCNSPEEWQQRFQESILNKFIDGETFVEFS